MAQAHVFFAASAGVAGALIGLLFVAISVAPERVLGPEASEVHSVRAAATLTSFTNALAVSLFGLVPEMSPAVPAISVALIGLTFMLGALVRLIPLARAREIRLREISFLAGLAVIFVVQLIAAIELNANHANRDALQTVCILVAVCFIVGIERAWELVGGPHIGLFNSIARRRREGHEEEDQGLGPR